MSGPVIKDPAGQEIAERWVAGRATTGWKGTPGPWKAEQHPPHMSGCRRITAKVGPQHKQAKRTELACTSGMHDDAEDAANAKGMAAVPQLVGALLLANAELRRLRDLYGYQQTDEAEIQTTAALRAAGVRP